MGPTGQKRIHRTLSWLAMKHWGLSSALRQFMALLLTIAGLGSIQSAVAQTSPQTPANRPDAQQDSPVRLKTDLLEVRAVITDRAGRLIDNLNQQDFELSEDGQAQTLRFFSLERISAATAAAASSAKLTPPRNQSGRPGVQPTRTIVLFVDTLHLSPANVAGIKDALKRFVNEQMSDQDLVAVKTSSGTLGLFEQFTRDRQLLRFAIDRLRPWG